MHLIPGLTVSLAVDAIVDAVITYNKNKAREILKDAFKDKKGSDIKALLDQIDANNPCAHLVSDVFTEAQKQPCAHLVSDVFTEAQKQLINELKRSGQFKEFKKKVNNLNDGENNVDIEDLLNTKPNIQFMMNRQKNVLKAASIFMNIIGVILASEDMARNDAKPAHAVERQQIIG